MTPSAGSTRSAPRCTCSPSSRKLHRVRTADSRSPWRADNSPIRALTAVPPVACSSETPAAARAAAQ